MPAGTFPQWAIISETRVPSGAYTFRWNGATLFKGATSYAGGLDGLAINSSTSAAAAETSTCQVAEVALYSNVILNIQQLEGVEAYLKTKWGLL